MEQAKKRKRNILSIKIESRGGNDEMSMETRSISSAVINGIIHASHDTFYNSSASGSTI